MLFSLEEYKEIWTRIHPDFFLEQSHLYVLFKKFLEEDENAFERENFFGHVTGSAFILSSDRTHLLLTHHKKLDKWIQLGGHADSNPDIYEVALKEAKEESSLNSIKLFPLELLAEVSAKYPVIFDLDRHIIPARKEAPEHFHYDVRYLFLADRFEKIEVSDESFDVQWVSIKEILSFNSETSITRPVRKIEYILKNLLA